MAAGVARVGDTLPTTGRSTAIPAIAALSLLTLGAILTYAARHNREVGR